MSFGFSQGSATDVSKASSRLHASQYLTNSGGTDHNNQVKSRDWHSCYSSQQCYIADRCC